MPIKVNIQSPLPAKYIWRLLLLIWTAVMVIYPWTTQSKDWGNGYQEYRMGQSLAFADILLSAEELRSPKVASYDRLYRDWPAFNHLFREPRSSHILQWQVTKDMEFKHYLANDQLKSARLIIEPTQVNPNIPIPAKQPVAGINFRRGRLSDLYKFIIETRPGITPAHIQLLLDYGYELNQLNQDDNTPLNLTLISNLNSPLTEDPSVAFLLKNGSNPNLYAKENLHAYPPLFYTRFDSDDPHIDILLQYGANPYLKVRDESFIEMLRRRGMDSIANDIEARYPAHQYKTPE